MKYSIVENEDEMAKSAAKRIAALIREKQARGEKAVIGLATGSTPIKVYAELVRMHREEGLSFYNVVTFNLDEYVVDKNAHPDFYERYESYHGFMREHLFRHVDIAPENIHIPDGMADDLEKECKDYERKIQEAGGIDLQLVGIGRNGHIGFNEPGSPLSGSTAIVDLDPETIAVNVEKFGFASPRAITMGLGTIMKAKQIVLVAAGDTKTEALHDMAHAVSIPHAEGWSVEQHRRNIDKDIEGNPSRVLKYHSDVEAIVDRTAGASILIAPEELFHRPGMSR